MAPNEKTDPVKVLPCEILLMVIELLPITAVWSLRSISRAYNDFLQDERLLEKRLSRYEMPEAPGSTADEMLARRTGIFKAHWTGKPAGWIKASHKIAREIVLCRTPVLEGHYLADAIDEHQVRLIDLRTSKTFVSPDQDMSVRFLALTRQLLIYASYDVIYYHSIDKLKRRHKLTSPGRVLALGGHENYIAAICQSAHREACLLLWEATSQMEVAHLIIWPRNRTYTHWQVSLQPGICVIAFCAYDRGDTAPVKNEFARIVQVRLKGDYTCLSQETSSLEAHDDQSGFEFVPEYLRLQHTGEDNTWHLLGSCDVTRVSFHGRLHVSESGKSWKLLTISSPNVGHWKNMVYSKSGTLLEDCTTICASRLLPDFRLQQNGMLLRRFCKKFRDSQLLISDTFLVDYIGGPYCSFQVYTFDDQIAPGIVSLPQVILDDDLLASKEPSRCWALSIPGKSEEDWWTAEDSWAERDNDASDESSDGEGWSDEDESDWSGERQAYMKGQQPSISSR